MPCSIFLSLSLLGSSGFDTQTYTRTLIRRKTKREFDTHSYTRAQIVYVCLSEREWLWSNLTEKYQRCCMMMVPLLKFRYVRIWRVPFKCLRRWWKFLVEQLLLLTWAYLVSGIITRHHRHLRRHLHNIIFVHCNVAKCCDGRVARRAYRNSLFFFHQL